jgi:hypothetical protein
MAASTAPPTAELAGATAMASMLARISMTLCWLATWMDSDSGLPVSRGVVELANRAGMGIWRREKRIR